MFDWLKKITAPAPRLDDAEAAFLQMLAMGRHMLELASEALLGRAPAESVREELFATDRKIDAAEQTLRRRLIVHASIAAGPDFPSCLVLMSISKDAERIGDYCKNLFDLAALQSVGADHPHHETLKDVAAELFEATGEIAGIYREHGDDRARGVIKRLAKIEDRCDARIDRLVSGADDRAGARESVVAALALRYMKRVASHAMNIMTAVVMPVDKLDFFDER